MSNILLQQSVALVPLRDGVIGAFFDGSEEYRQQYQTDTESVVLSNGVKLLGIEIVSPNDDNLVNHVRLYYVPSESESWKPNGGMVGNRIFNEGPVRTTAGDNEHKVAILPLNSADPIAPGIVNLIIS